jgi:TonB-dependent receptor
VLFGGASVLAMSLAMPAFAQNTQTMETVTVTGQRAAIESAVKIKESADQIVDSIVADDAGKLPDRSITEVLQRVSGVTITHFADLKNPDNYTVEGSGPAVRGLPGGTSTLNGHHVFSANSGRQILWGDVPSELMAAVDIYKTYTPDQIEGGLGGTINLRTHLPFDFDGTKLAGGFSMTYGDLVKTARPRASLLGSTRFDTKWGEMGVLLDLSYDNEAYRSDSIQVEPYFPHTNVVDNYTLQSVGGVPTPQLKSNPTTYWMPGGFDYHTGYGFGKRMGANFAFQWHPSDQLSFFVKAFASLNDTSSYAYNFAGGGGGHDANITYTVMPAYGDANSSRNKIGASNLVTALSGSQGASDPYYHLFDSNNYLLKTNSFMDAGYIYANDQYVADSGGLTTHCPDPNNFCSRATTTTDTGKKFARTSDVEIGANWTPTENWLVRMGADYIYSKAQDYGNATAGSALLAQYGLDLSGTYPTISVSDPDSLKISSTYYWNNTMYHQFHSYGHEAQVYADAEYTLNYGMLKTIKFGARGTIRLESDKSSGYDWEGLSPIWSSPQYWFSDPASKKDISLYQFPNFFRGAVNLPGQAYFPSLDKVEMYDVGYYHCQYDNYAANHYADGTCLSNKANDPYQAQHHKTVNVAGYAMVTFAKDNFFGMPLSGNAGARLVYVDNTASGYMTQSDGSAFRFTQGGQIYTLAYVGDPNSGGLVSWTLLPAFNLQVMPTDRIHIRLAGSITAQQPDMAAISGNRSVTTDNDTNRVATTFNYDGDNPRLKPQLGRNLDVSFEWYGDNGATAYLSAFYKSIKHRQVTGVVLRNMNWTYGISGAADGSCTKTNNHCLASSLTNVQTTSELTYGKSSYNSDKEEVIRGTEVGFTKYFDWDFVPSYAKGFGVSGNFTYVDSKAPGEYSFDMYGNNIGDRLPAAGLSHYSLNAQLMYDRDPISFRLAYNWRSKYLMSASGWNTQGTYKGDDNGITCLQNNTVASGGGYGGNLRNGYCTYSLPVWSKSFGSLDTGLDYKIDEYFSMSVQSQNLLNTPVKTTMGYGSQERGRSWFIADRRVSIDIRANY